MVSIIVPVYNAEKYLNGCIDSILRQSYDNFELILADDGSSDSSPAICDKYAAQDKRVTVIHKTNGGSSSARNAGITAAKGEFIAFVDSDDTVSPDYLRLLVKNIDGHDISIGTPLMNLSLENRSVTLTIADKSYCLEQFKADIRSTYKSQYVNSPWNKLFRTEIIKNNGILFDEAMNVGEDCVFCLTYLDRTFLQTGYSILLQTYSVRVHAHRIL